MCLLGQIPNCVFVELLFSLNLCCHYQKKPLAQQLRPVVSTDNEIVIQSLPRRIMLDCEHNTTWFEMQER